MNKKLVTFLDTVGRTIIGEEVESPKGEGYLGVKNPVIVHIVPNQQTNQMALQLFPLFFKEFQADKNEDTVWSYNRSTIDESDGIILDIKLQSQYANMFSNIILPDQNIVSPAEAKSQGGKVVKMFED